MGLTNVPWVYKVITVGEAGWRELFTVFTTLVYILNYLNNFPGSPVVKTSLSSAGVPSSVADWEAKIPYALEAKKIKA